MSVVSQTVNRLSPADVAVDVTVISKSVPALANDITPVTRKWPCGRFLVYLGLSPLPSSPAGRSALELLSAVADVHQGS